jgi:hypothetical protein
MTNKNNYKQGVGIFELLTIIFVVLKLTETIDWTWWQVFSPAIIAFSAGLVEGFIEVIVEYSQKKRREND